MLATHSSGSGSPTFDESDWEAIRKIMQLLATYMGKRCPTDFLSVATDPTVGVRVMLQHRQAYDQALEAACDPLLAAEAGEAELISDAAAAALFACAAYGAPMREGRLDGVGAFAGGAAAHFFGKWTPAENSAAFVAMTGIREEDLLLASWGERTFEPAFCLSWSLGQEWLVLSVRGTVDWRAMLTDVAAHPVPICGGIAHEGMVRAARSIVERSLPLVRRSLHERPRYRVVCTGHSLGAGVAMLTALLLRSSGKLQGGGLEDSDPPALASTTAFGMGTPPLVNPGLADEMRPWALSIERGVDFISRLSVFSVDRFVFELTQASVAKMATDWLMRSIGMDASHERFKRHFGEGKEVAEVLVPPGRIIHLDTRGHETGRGAPAAFRATSSFYHRYILGTTMIADHLPKAYYVDTVLLAGAVAQQAVRRQSHLTDLESFLSPNCAPSPCQMQPVARSNLVNAMDDTCGSQEVAATFDRLRSAESSPKSPPEDVAEWE